MEECKTRMSARLRPPEMHDSGWQYGFKRGESPWSGKNSDFKVKWAIVNSCVSLLERPDGKEKLQELFSWVLDELVARMVNKGENIELREIVKQITSNDRD